MAELSHVLHPSRKKLHTRDIYRLRRFRVDRLKKPGQINNFELLKIAGSHQLRQLRDLENSKATERLLPEKRVLRTILVKIVPLRIPQKRAEAQRLEQVDRILSIRTICLR